MGSRSASGHICVKQIDNTVLLEYRIRKLKAQLRRKAKKLRRMESLLAKCKRPKGAWA